jgi:uncharacterized protein with HEPN domain
LDILDAIAVIETYLPADRSVFDNDPPLQSHIYRHMAIIGEASYKLSRELKQQNTEVPWPLIEGMRHILIHDYFKVNSSRVFDTARDHEPALKPQIESILISLPQTEERGHE